VGLRESDEPDKIQATITVREEKPWNIAASLSNGGSESTGRDRFTLTGVHSNVLNLDHQFTGAYTTSLQRTGAVKQLGLAYKAPLYVQGVVLGASYTRSDVVGTFGAFSSTGAGHTFGVTATKYMAPEGGRRSYITLGLDDKVFNGTTVNGLVSGPDRRSRPISIGYTARTESDISVWGYDIALAVNTGSGRGNDLAAYHDENDRVDTVHWKAVRASLSHVAPFAGNWLLSARASYQYSPDVLISGEQFGLGGLGSVRGTDLDRPITGDFGVQGTLEATTPELAPGLRLLGFVDAGWLGNHKAAAAQGKLSSDSLASAGLGLRYGWRFLALSAEYGRIVSGSKVPLAVNPAAPKRGDDRFYVNLSVRF
jgi:hemolysin activation/secretion protein